MCGKYIIFMHDEVLGIIQRIEVGPRDNSVPEWPARPVSAHPGTVAPVITARFDTAQPEPLREGMLEAQELIWGYEADWSPGLVFNTRLDSAGKALWRDSVEHRRCIIPCRAFFENSESETVPSPRTGKPIKRRYEFRLPGDEPILIGGIWQNNRYSMVTTEPNPDMAPIHHRMPLIMRPEEVGTWLGPDYRTLADRSSIRLEVEPESFSGEQLSFL